jgi:hypothetical protein
MADRTVRVTITGDSTSAEAAFLKLDAAAAASGISLERHSVASVAASGKTKELGTVAEQTAGAFQKDLRTGVDDIANAFGSHFGPAAGTATTAVRSMGNEILGASGVMKVAAGAAVVGGIAVLGLGAYALASVDSWTKLAAEVRQFQRVSGDTAEDSSKLIYTMGELGISSDTAAAAMFKMTRADPGKLAELGVQVKYNADGSKDLAGTLDAVRLAYQATQDPVQRNLILFTAFGKAGQALAPYLAQSTEQLQKFNEEADKHHAIFTQEDVNRAREYDLASKALSQTMEGFGRELAVAVIPALTAVVHGATDVIETIDRESQKIVQAKGTHDLLTNSLHSLADAWRLGNKPLVDLNSGLDNGTAATKKSSDAWSTLGDVWRWGNKDLTDLIPGMDKATKSTEQHSQAVDKEKETEDAVADANRAAMGTIYGLTTAHTAAIVALATHKDVTDKDSDATKALVANAKELTKQQDDLAKAIGSFIDPMAVYTAATTRQAAADEAAAKAAGLSKTQQEYSQDDWIAHTHVTTQQYLVQHRVNPSGG